MNREIKFRVFDEERELMGVVTEITYYDNGSGPCWVRVNIPQLAHLQSYYQSNFIEKTAILMQYTGLKDRNNNEIYEGDILEITGNYNPGKYIVMWDDYRVAWWGKSIKCDKRERQHDDDYYQLLGSWQDEITEVIGNIYENPELLEVE